MPMCMGNLRLHSVGMSCEGVLAAMDHFSVDAPASLGECGSYIGTRALSLACPAAGLPSLAIES